MPILPKYYNSMEEGQNKSIMDHQNEWLSSSELYPAFSPQNKTTNTQENDLNDLNTLHKAKERYLKFANDTVGLGNSNIRPDILSYCLVGFKKEKVRDESFDFSYVQRHIDSRIEKMRKTKRIKKNWGQEDLKILVWVVSKYSLLRKMAKPDRQMDKNDWAFVAGLIPGVTPSSCMFKWLGLKKVTLANNNWTVQESRILGQLVFSRSQGGTLHCSEIKDWKQISQELYHLNTDLTKCYRNAKQCREHWTCYLSPKLKKGPWTLHEDIKLFRFIHSNKGSKKWSQIAKQFNGRTENALKNRYTLLIDKQKKMYKRSIGQLQLIKLFLENNELTEMIQNDSQCGSLSAQDLQQQQRFTICQEIEEQTERRFRLEQKQKIFPSRVEKFEMGSLAHLSSDFLKFLQPGTISSTGQFKKILKQNQKVIQKAELGISDFKESYFPQSSFIIEDEYFGYCLDQQKQD